MHIVFDIGGTNTRIAASKDGATLTEPVIYPTSQDFDVAIQQFIDTAQQLSGGEQIQTIAGGMPGPMDTDKTMVVKAPNLKSWNNKPFKKLLEEKLFTKVILENDTAMWGLGEAMHGAGMGHDIMVYMTVSTGVGGTRIVQGKIDESAQGFEPGHQIISPDGPECGCGGNGHLEAYISGTALQKKYNMLPQEIQDPAVWEEQAYLLAIGLLNTTVFWSPSCIVLGGSVMKDVPLERVEAHLKSLNHIMPTLPVLKRSTLGSTGGLLGALELARLAG